MDFIKNKIGALKNVLGISYSSEQRNLPYDDSFLEGLYKKRKASQPTVNQRSKMTLGFSLGLLFLMVISLGSIALIEKNTESKINTIEGIQSVQQPLDWVVRAEKGFGCTDGTKTCLNDLLAKPVLFSGNDIDKIEFQGNAPEKTGRWLTLSTVIVADTLNVLEGSKVSVITLPELNYKNIWIYLDGKLVRTLVEEEDIVVQFSTPKNIRDIRLDLVVNQYAKQDSITDVSPSLNPPVIGNRVAYDLLEKYRLEKEEASGAKLRSMARIVLAIFCVLLFVFIDSSPESLALAVFMSLKGVGVGVAQGWFLDWQEGPVQSVFRDWVFCFADIMQLYFFTQLTRLFRPKIWTWVAAGSVVALLYAIPSALDLKEVGSISWVKHFWAFRSVSIGLACWVLVALSLYAIWSKQLYWRLSAMSVASLGVIVQVITPIISYFPNVYETDLFGSVYYILETCTPYVFALSTFINISTLEARVKQLSNEVSQAREIEKEMSLGQTVQRSFMQTPVLPEEYGFSYHNEAAFYVSGDIFFVNWNPERQVLTTILNDITGHGVQAALKASICTAMAESIWEGQINRHPNESLSNMEVYEKRIRRHLDRINGIDDIVSIIGFEFHARKELISLFRINGIFPIVISRNISQRGYDVQVMPLENRIRYDLFWPTDSFIVLLSDGYIETSRTMLKLQNYLKSRLSTEHRSLSEDKVRSIFLEFDAYDVTNDDKTILVLHRRIAIEAKQSKAS